MRMFTSRVVNWAVKNVAYCSKCDTARGRNARLAIISPYALLKRFSLCGGRIEVTSEMCTYGIRKRIQLRVPNALRALAVTAQWIRALCKMVVTPHSEFPHGAALAAFTEKRSEKIRALEAPRKAGVRAREDEAGWRTCHDLRTEA